MFWNHLTIAWRNISRNKGYSLINVLGLSLGIGACMVIFLVTSYELSFDTFHPEKERIYRILGDPVSPAVRQELPGLDAIAGIIPYRATISIPVDGQTNQPGQANPSNQANQPGPANQQSQPNRRPEEAIGKTVYWNDIAVMLSREFSVLITIAALIASPIAWYFMNRWLANFAYRITIHWWIFLLGGLSALLIALSTVGYLALQAARRNPVKSLRTE